MRTYRQEAPYYLYEMTPPIDEEAEIRYEVEEDEEERDDEDFNTDEEYEAYLTVRKYYKAKLAMDAGKRKTKKLKNKKSAKSK